MCVRARVRCQTMTLNKCIFVMGFICSPTLKDYDKFKAGNLMELQTKIAYLTQSFSCGDALSARD